MRPSQVFILEEARRRARKDEMKSIFSEKII
jgi:hypothetical protein